jgi:hypothetical protein
MSARRGSKPVRGRVAIVAALSSALLALAASSPALGAEVPNHPFKKIVIGGVFDPEATPPVSKLEAPCGVAVNSSGTVFVSDYYRHTVVGANPAIPDNPLNGPCALSAVDPLNLYVNLWHDGVINPVTGTIAPEPATGIAVDPEYFDLYIDHGTSVDYYPAPITPGESPTLEIGKGTLEEGYGVAISKFKATEGQIYVADAADHRIKVYDPKVSVTTPVREIDGASTAAGSFVSLVDASLALDQSDGHLFVVDNTQPGFEHPLAAVSEFNAEGLFRGELQHTLIDGEPTGITVNESITPAFGDIYVTSGNGTSEVITPTGGIEPGEMGSLLAFGPAGKGKYLSASVTGAGEGTVTSSPAGINCPEACKAELNEGATVLLTATPKAGSAFNGWTGACSGTGTCSVTLNAAASVAADFVPAPSASAVSARIQAGPTAQAGPPAPAAGSLRLGKLNALGSGMAALRLTVDASGTVTATGRGLRAARAHLARAGSISLPLRLSQAGRRALAKSKTNRLALRVAVSFKPSGGGAGSARSKIVTFK